MRTSKELLGLKQSDYKQTVLFCEEKFIRRYDVDKRQVLIDQFDEQIGAYCDELGCPFDDDVEREEYIVSLAIDVMYATKSETYKKVKTAQNSQKGSTVNKPFREGLAKLAERLQVRVHEREAVTLEACQLVVAKLAQSSKSSQNQSQKLYQAPPLGLDTGDKALNQTALVLRLLHIDELRQLQNEVNRAIVDTQRLTANPITDTKLGRVGR